MEVGSKALVASDPQLAGTDWQQLSMLQTNLPCPICGKTWVTRQHLRSHVLSHYSQQILNISNTTGFLECVDCSLEFKVKHALVNHFAFAHSKLKEVSGSQNLVEYLWRRGRSGGRRPTAVKVNNLKVTSLNKRAKQIKGTNDEVSLPKRGPGRPPLVKGSSIKSQSVSLGMSKVLSDETRSNAKQTQSDFDTSEINYHLDNNNSETDNNDESIPEGNHYETATTSSSASASYGYSNHTTSFDEDKDSMKTDPDDDLVLEANNIAELMNSDVILGSIRDDLLLGGEESCFGALFRDLAIGNGDDE
jgi:hypothetical protein